MYGKTAEKILFFKLEIVFELIERKLQHWIVYTIMIILECERLTVPATDFDDKKVFALNLDNPKSHT
jgi:hypothetical protein